jgi:hypothetical protein
MKCLKPLIRHLPANISAEDITVVFQETHYDVMSVKQLTAKRPTPEGAVTRLPPLCLVTLAKNKKL